MTGRTLRRTATRLTLAAALIFPVLPASAASEQPWIFEGGGWGHGVGMSQFGVLGQVQGGRSVEQILRYYYTGTSLGAVPGDHWVNNPDGLWIGLVANTTTVNLEAVGGPVTFCQPLDDCTFEQTINPGELWRFEVNLNEPTQCRLRFVGQGFNPTWGPCSAGVTGLSTSNRVSLNGRQYARGVLRFDPASSGFHAVVTLPLEQYLYGLAEVPSSWPDKALQVQAITGRSYAVAVAKDRGGSDGSGKLSACGCHLRASTLDQVYVGWSKEADAFGPNWRAAVEATGAQVVVYNSATVKTYYSSSNGGASENNEDVWGGSPLPYLRSVDDPWSADPGVNPLATWSVRVTDEAMAGYFGWDRALDAFVVSGPPGVRVQFTGWDNGGEVSQTLSGPQMVSLVRSLGFGYFAPGSPNSTSIRVSPYFTSVIDPPGFDDIIGNTFEADIDWAGAVGVTKGCNPPDNTLFCPENDVTRGQMAAFLTRYLGLPQASRDFFTDDEGSTFEDDINRLAEAGITRGCNPPANTRFCPREDVTRAQMAAFLVRAFDLTATGHPGFSDVPASNTFHDDIVKLGAAGITRGCNPPTNTRYCPANAVTRGQMAAFLHRADQLD
jgi:hypothetical protein